MAIESPVMIRPGSIAKISGLRSRIWRMWRRPSPNVRSLESPIRFEYGGRDLDDPEARPCAAHEHLGGELHPRRDEVDLGELLATESAESRLAVPDEHLVPGRPPEQQRDERRADIPVEPRHRVLVGDARAQDEVGAAVHEWLEQSWDRREVVGAVGVGHDDVAGASLDRSPTAALPRSRAGTGGRPRRPRPSRPRPSRRWNRCRRPAPRR